MSVSKMYLWLCDQNNSYAKVYSKFTAQGVYILVKTKTKPNDTSQTLIDDDDMLDGINKTVYNFINSNPVVSSNLFENVDSANGLLSKNNLKNVTRISDKLYEVTDSEGNVLPLIQMDVDHMVDTFGLSMLKSVQEKASSTHFEYMKIEKVDITDKDKTAALEKLLVDSGGKSILKDNITRKLVLVVDFPDNIKSLGAAAASARVSSQAGTISASRAARIKLAVAADHVNGTPFTASKALIAGESASHPLVAAVMGLRIGASSYAVNRVLDMAPSAHHAVNEVEEAMKMVAAHPHDVVSVYPCGVATRLLDNDTDGAVTEALSRVF